MTTPGPRASDTEAYNRAGERLSEGSTITGDPANGTATTGYGCLRRPHQPRQPGRRGGDLVWTYDAWGNRLTQRNRTDPVHTVSVAWTYDAAGRMLARTADGSTTSYTYDPAGNRLSATTGTMSITATYDRLGRVLTVDDEDAGTTPDTTYTWAVGAGGVSTPSWTDPTGSYTATLDKVDRPVAMTDSVSPSGWTTTYGASGQVLSATQGNGNTVTSTFDATGRESTRTTTDSATTRAAYAWTHNRAGLVLSEASTITGDPANGTIGYGYDPLGRLTTAGTTGYTWDAATNRTGAGSATTAFDAANRPTSGTSPTASYTSDPDGRLTARPGQTMTWDHLGRLTSVTTASGTTTYTYDPLDRLRTVTVPGGAVTRFRYTGLTTSAAQLLDGSGTVTRDVGNGWGGERLLDWVPGSPATDLRYHGTNAHRDTTWLADSTGAVISALRYDPWGVPRSAVPAGWTPFRFQGSWHDSSTDLAWVVTRWYAPSLGTFISEDSLLGEPRDPDSRHLYAYAQGEPVGRWDPDGHWGCSTKNRPCHVRSKSEVWTWGHWLLMESLIIVACAAGVVGAGALVVASGGVASPIAMVLLEVGCGLLGSAAVTKLAPNPGDRTTRSVMLGQYRAYVVTVLHHENGSLKEIVFQYYKGQWGHSVADCADRLAGALDWKAWGWVESRCRVAERVQTYPRR